MVEHPPLLGRHRFFVEDPEVRVVVVGDYREPVVVQIR
jgi:hypothetical protein